MPESDLTSKLRKHETPILKFGRTFLQNRYPIQELGCASFHDPVTHLPLAYSPPYRQSRVYPLDVESPATMISFAPSINGLTPLDF